MQNFILLFAGSKLIEHIKTDKNISPDFAQAQLARHYEETGTKEKLWSDICVNGETTRWELDYENIRLNQIELPEMPWTVMKASDVDSMYSFYDRKKKESIKIHIMRTIIKMETIPVLSVKGMLQIIEKFIGPVTITESGFEITFLVLKEGEVFYSRKLIDHDVIDYAKKFGKTATALFETHKEKITKVWAARICFMDMSDKGMIPYDIDYTGIDHYTVSINTSS